MTLKQIAVLISCLFAGHTVGLTTIPSVENGGTVVVAAPEDEANVVIFCAVTQPNNNIISTNWFLIMGSTREQIFANTPNFNIGSSPFSSLTILTFVQNLAGATVECSNLLNPGRQEAFFTLRIIKPPVLRRLSTPMVEVEDSSFSYTNIQDAPGFPDPPLYQWYYNGVPINRDTSINPNVSVYPLIVFDPVLRTHSGNYSVTAITEGGNATGYFILAVHYPVKAAVSKQQMFYGVVGDNITLVAHVNITGNPVPGSVWMFNGSIVTRGDTSVSGQLTIINITTGDDGNYSNTLSNMLNNGSTPSLSNTIRLQVLTRPSEPSILNVTDIGSESITIHWTNPSSSTAPLSRFIVELTPTADPSSVITRTITVSYSNLSSSNAFTVKRLQPNTNYSVRIRAVSTHPAVGDIVGTLSVSVPFTTMLGEPKFAFAHLEIVGGKLNISYGFKHTGGLPLLSVMVKCHSVEEGSSSGLTSDMNCGTGNSLCSDGVAVIPTGSEYVTAGMNYSCSVNATHEFASERLGTEHVLAKSGIPSAPMINSVTGGVNMFTLTVQLYAGHTSSLYFNVSIINTQTNAVLLMPDLRSHTSVSPNLMNYTITVLFGQSGQYRFTVSAGNQFGRTMESESYPSMMMDGVALIPSPPATTTTGTVGSITLATTSTTQPSPVGNPISAGFIVGAVVVLIAVVLIVFIVLLVIGLVIYRNRGKHESVKSTVDATQFIDLKDNGAYSTVRMQHATSHSIEMKDNAAYGTVGIQSATSQSIAMSSNTAYAAASVKADHVYDCVIERPCPRDIP